MFASITVFVSAGENDYCPAKLWDGSANPYFLVRNMTTDIFKVDHQSNIYTYQMTNCDSIDTDGTGKWSCGVDADTHINVFDQNLNTTEDVQFNDVVINRINLSEYLYIPSYFVHQGDTNTMMGFVAEDNIQFRTGGSERMIINNSGIVINGIGYSENDVRIESDGSSKAFFVDAGANIISMAVPLNSTQAGVFTTLDTGQGANELYDMNQNVGTGSNVQFNSTYSTVFVINKTMNMCMVQNGTDLIIANNVSGVTC